MKPSSMMISQKVITPDKHLCDRLQISEDEKVIFTQRLSLVGDELSKLLKINVNEAVLKRKRLSYSY